MRVGFREGIAPFRSLGVRKGASLFANVLVQVRFATFIFSKVGLVYPNKSRVLRCNISYIVGPCMILSTDNR